MSNQNVFSTPVRTWKAEQMGHIVGMTQYRKGGSGPDNQGKAFNPDNSRP